MSKPNKLYLSAILTFTGVSIFFIGEYFFKNPDSDLKITNTAALLNKKVSDSLHKAEQAGGGEAPTSIPEDFDL